MVSGGKFGLIILRLSKEKGIVDFICEETSME